MMNIEEEEFAVFCHGQMYQLCLLAMQYNFARRANPKNRVMFWFYKFALRIEEEAVRQHIAELRQRQEP